MKAEVLLLAAAVETAREFYSEYVLTDTAYISIEEYVLKYLHENYIHIKNNSEIFVNELKTCKDTIRGISND